MMTMEDSASALEDTEVQESDMAKPQHNYVH